MLFLQKVLRNHIKIGVLGLIINSPHSDVLMYTTTNIYTAEFWVHTGNVTTTADKQRYTPVHDISSNLDDTHCAILPEQVVIQYLRCMNWEKTVNKVLTKFQDQFKGLSNMPEMMLLLLLFLKPPISLLTSVLRNGKIKFITRSYVSWEHIYQRHMPILC